MWRGHRRETLPSQLWNNLVNSFKIMSGGKNQPILQAPDCAALHPGYETAFVGAGAVRLYAWKMGCQTIQGKP